jgi:sugar/nucleoside kinase (ribokinase family)
MTRILSGDILIADVIAPLDGNRQLWHLVEKYHMAPGDKQSLDETQLTEFSTALKGVSCTVTPGGSSANMLTTLSKLLGREEVEVRFLGMPGNGAYSDTIRESMLESGISLVPERFPLCLSNMEPAVSYVFTYPDGQCTIATYSGNAREVLKPAMIAEHLVKNSEVVLVQGSLWHKFHPEFSDRLLKLCEKHHRRLWLTLPTQPNLSVEEKEKFMSALRSASLVFGNQAELQRMYGLPLDQSLQHLQKTLRDHERAADESHVIAFITFGKDGAAVVGAHSIEQVAPMRVDDGEILNTLGAGDTAYAGFAAGYLKKLPDMVSAQLAMTLAAEKLRFNGPRLPDPKTTLNTVAPDFAQMLRNA